MTLSEATLKYAAVMLPAKIKSASQIDLNQIMESYGGLGMIEMMMIVVACVNKIRP